MNLKYIKRFCYKKKKKKSLNVVKSEERKNKEVSFLLGRYTVEEGRKETKSLLTVL